MKTIKENFSIKFEELIDFANYSGDWNPIHHDSEISRRYNTEKPISHGILSLIKVLDEYVKIRKTKIFAIKCKFVKPVYPEKKYKLFYEDISFNKVNLFLFDNETLLLSCNINCDDQFEFLNLQKEYNFPIKKDPLSTNFDKIKGQVGSTEILVDLSKIKTSFKELLKAISTESLISLISTSRLVGMICPGLNSLYSSLSVMCNKQDTNNKLNWEVKSADRKILPINLSFKSTGLEGQINVFYREAPIKQISINKLKDTIKIKNYPLSKVLIIGGNRGLGEITAKLLSFRNTDITITFNKGRKDALSVANEINNAGGRAKILHLDILKKNSINEFFKKYKDFNQLYFYASPRIKESSENGFDFSLYNNYNNFYVKSILEIVKFYKIYNSLDLKIFYPSTVFLDEKENHTFSEYKYSKMLGEKVCNDISNSDYQFKIIYERLPRLLTDQTSKLHDSLVKDNVEFISQVLDKMYE